MQIKREGTTAEARIEWVRESCRLLAEVGDEMGRTQPFAGLTIGTGIHLEPKTVALLLTLQRGGARVVSTGNLNSTQPSAVDYLQSNGVVVIGGVTRDQVERAEHLDAVLDERPHLILDNGGDLFARYLERSYEGLLGGTEETTSGRMRLAGMRDALRMPILVINDSPIKQFAENRHAVGQSVLESFLRITNRITNGRRVTVFGYGSCGRGVAQYFKANQALVSVVEVDPVARLEAHLDGYDVPSKGAGLRSADVVITITGAPRVITADDIASIRDGAILANAGHFPWEIDLDAIDQDPRVLERRGSADGMTTYRLDDGRSFHVIGSGHMMNLAGPRPLGNSIEAMDLGFTLQALCLQEIATGNVDRSACVVPVPRHVDEIVATRYVAMARAGVDAARPE